MRVGILLLVLSLVGAAGEAHAHGHHGHGCNGQSGNYGQYGDYGSYGQYGNYGSSGCRNSYSGGSFCNGGRVLGATLYASPSLDPSYRGNSGQGPMSGAQSSRGPDYNGSSPGYGSSGNVSTVTGRMNPEPPNGGVTSSWVNLGLQGQPSESAPQKPMAAIYNVSPGAPATVVQPQPSEAPSPALPPGVLPVSGLPTQTPGMWVYEQAYRRVVFIPAGGTGMPGLPGDTRRGLDIPIQPGAAALNPQPAPQAVPADYVSPSQATGLPSVGGSY